MAEAIHNRAASGDEAPKVAIEGAEFLLPAEERLRVADGGGDFQAVADDAGVGEEGGDFAGIEAIERAPVVFAFGEKSGPARAGLGTFENEQSKERAVVAMRDAPLGAVVDDIGRLGGPRAAGIGQIRESWRVGDSG